MEGWLTQTICWQWDRAAVLLTDQWTPNFTGMMCGLLSKEVQVESRCCCWAAQNSKAKGQQHADFCNRCQQCACVPHTPCLLESALLTSSALFLLQSFQDTCRSHLVVSHIEQHTRDTFSWFKPALKQWASELCSRTQILNPYKLLFPSLNYFKYLRVKHAFPVFCGYAFLFQQQRWANCSSIFQPLRDVLNCWREQVQTSICPLCYNRRCNTYLIPSLSSFSGSQWNDFGHFASDAY